MKWTVHLFWGYFSYVFVKLFSPEVHEVEMWKQLLKAEALLKTEDT